MRSPGARCDDAVELHVDLGYVEGRPFVNNASFGACAAVVQSPAHRDDKADTAEAPRRATAPSELELGGPVAAGKIRSSDWRTLR